MYVALTPFILCLHYKLHLVTVHKQSYKEPQKKPRINKNARFSSIPPKIKPTRMLKCHNMICIFTFALHMMMMLLHIFSTQSQSGCVVSLNVIPKSYKFSSHTNDIHEERCGPALCQELVPIVKTVFPRRCRPVAAFKGNIIIYIIYTQKLSSKQYSGISLK